MSVIFQLFFTNPKITEVEKMLKQIENIILTSEERAEQANKIVKLQQIRENAYLRQTKREFVELRENKVEELKEQIKDKIVISDLNSGIPYCFNSEKGIYEQITPVSLGKEVNKVFLDIPYTTKRETDNITDTLFAVYQTAIIEHDFKQLIRKDKLSIAFNNGTLYFKNSNGKITKEFVNTFDCADFNIIKLNMDYTEPENIDINNSIFFAWIRKKFNNKNYENFFCAYLADLLQPFNYSQTALFLWGTGGIGKNVFENVLKKNLDTKISALEVEDLAEKFQNVAIIESAINISNEISKKDINSKLFNKCISRENLIFQYKGKNVFTTRPLAKWLIFANNPLKIEMTAGVRRRILTLEMQEERIHHWQGKAISKHEFEQLMLADQKGFIFAVMLGTVILLHHNLDVKSAYDELVGKGENAKLEEHNQDQLQDFLQEYLVQDKNSAVLTRELTEVFNYLVSETDNPIVAGAKEVTIKKLTFELRNNQEYSKNLYKLDNPQRGLKKGTYLFGYKLVMDEDKKIQVSNIEKVDQIEFLRNELNKK